MNVLPDYEVGDVVEYETFGGRPRRVLVSYKSHDIKNGEPGFDGTLIGPGSEPFGVWGYSRQIIAVHKTTRGDAA